MQSELLSATILLILVIDPFGNVPLVVSALQATPARAERASSCANASSPMRYCWCFCSADMRFSR